MSNRDKNPGKTGIRTRNGHGLNPAGSEASGSGWMALFRAFRHRNYRLFFTGQFISLTGTWMQSVAQAWLVYKLTGSAVSLGLVGFCGQIPVFLLSPVGGAIADRVPRRRILVITQTAAMLLAFGLASVTLSNLVRVWHVVLFAAMLGIVNAFDVPARQAFVADMVGKDDLINAIALNSSMFNSARIIGPAVAGVLVAAIGEGWCFLLNGLSYMAVIIGLLSMKLKVSRIVHAGSVLSSIYEGFHHLAHAHAVRSLLLLLGLISLVGMPYAVLMPIFADQILHGGARGLGLLMGSTGVGALCGALILAARRGTRGLGTIIFGSALGFGASLILFSLSRSFWISALTLFPVGFCMMVGMASSNTLIQTLTPDRLRGRVMSVYSMMFLGMAPFGALLAGSLAHKLGAPTTVALGGAVCLIATLCFGSRLFTVRSDSGRMIIALRMTGGDPAEENIGESAALVDRR